MLWAYRNAQPFLPLGVKERATLLGWLPETRLIPIFIIQLAARVVER